jgi:hypothetical protein
MYDSLVYIGYFLSFINLVLYIKSYSSQDKTFNVFTLYLGIVFCIQMISSIYVYFSVNNLFLSHFYFIGQLVILSFFYYLLLKTIMQKRFLKFAFVLGILALSIHYFLDPSQFFKFNLFEIAVTSLLVVVFAMMHLYNMLAEEKEFYYVTVGIIIYLLGSTVLFFVGNLTVGLSSEFKFLTWTLNAVLIIVYQLFILFEYRKSFTKVGSKNKLY